MAFIIGDPSQQPKAPGDQSPSQAPSQSHGPSQTPSSAGAIVTEDGAPLADTGSAPAMGGGQGPDIVDADINNFEAEVIKASMERPVLLDFWASWCGPCKQLTPILEKVVTEARGAIKLVKVDADQNPELCQMLQVQSLPTVFALFEGRPVDAFMGAQPESQIREFVSKLAKLAGPAALPLDQMVEDAQAALDQGEAGDAYELFAGVLGENPTHAKAIAGAARALIALGEIEAATALLDDVPTNLSQDGDIQAARSALDVTAQAADAGPLGELQQAMEADGDNQQTKIDYAVAAFAAGEEAAAMDALLASIAADRDWEDGAARTQLLKYFETLGPTHPLTGQYRRKLSAILFS
ncbi:MAG: tetratricopeptide repeat protein [Pseudomonadota bacterium]